jgi:hypothetical protein
VRRTRELAKAYDRRHLDLPVFTEKTPVEKRAEKFAQDINNALSRDKRPWQV